ncbi:MAG: M56 family metallopeptidase [Isosphaeraceae bacterium]
MGNGLAALTKELSGFGLTWLVQSSVLLALGLLAGRVLRRSGPAVQSGVYRTTLAAVLICPVASAALSALGFNGLTLELTSLETPAPPELVPPPSLPTIELPARSNVSVVPLREGHGEDHSMPIAADQAETLPSASLSVPDVPNVASPRLFMSPAAVGAIGLAVWLVGATFLAVRLLVGQTRMRRLRASAVPADAGTEALLREVARQMNVAAPTVWRSPFLFSPCLDGLRRPAILLPDDVGRNLRETFVHELAHLARRDGLWNLLRRSASGGLWLQPLVWLLSRRLEVTAEEVCDDYVIHFGADPAHYAGHLLELAGRALPPVAPATVGMISLRSMLARRIVRILDTSRSLSTQAGTRAVLGMLAVGLALTFFASLLGVDGKSAAEARTTAEAGDPRPDPADRTIRGQVVGPDGKPVAGAAVIAWRARLDSNGIGDAYVPPKPVALERKITGSDGRYEFHFETPPPAAEARLIATAPGYGVSYALKDRQIRLTAGDLPIDGRLVDLEGRPVTGVKVSLGRVELPQSEVAQKAGPPKEAGEPATETPAPSGAQVSPAGAVSGRLILDAEGLLPDGIVTDSDGRFRIAGLGRDVLAELTLSGPTIALRKVIVVTRPMDRVNETLRDVTFQGIEDPAIHGARCTIAVEPTRPIEGFVREAETNQPISGAVVTAAILSGSEISIDGMISTETDARGHYRLIGLPKAGARGHTLAVYPPMDRPYFITRQIEAPAKPGFEPVSLDIALKSGTWITGKVTDVATGKPVAAAVDYFPVLTNGHAKDYPNFDANVTSYSPHNTRYKTDKEGRFRIVGLPGEGVVTAHTFDKSYIGGVGADSIKGHTEDGQLLTYGRISPKLYQSLRPVSVPEGGTSFACDLAVDPGKSLLLRIVDQAGAPVTDAAIWGGNPEESDVNQILEDESVARIAGLEPGKPRRVLIQESDRKLGAVLTILPERPRNSAEMTVTLRPTAILTGRLVDSDGKPAKGVVDVELTPDAAAHLAEILVGSADLDSTGRFRFEDIPAGGPYGVGVADTRDVRFLPRMEPETFQFELAQGLKLDPGQVLDFGTFDVTTGRRVKEAGPRKRD